MNCTSYSAYGCGCMDIKVENVNMVNLMNDSLSYHKTALVNKDINEITFMAQNGNYTWATIKKYLVARNLLYS